jgi:hypothetical protein
MLNRPKRRIVLGIVLLAIAALGLSVAGGRWQLLETRSHDVIRIPSVDGIAKVFVDCHLAALVESGEPGKTVDLGWLESDDQISLSVTSIDSTPAWSFSGTANGNPLLNESHRGGELPQLTTAAHAVVFAKTFSAAGTGRGTIGCQPANFVAIAGPLNVVATEGYAWSADDRKVAEVTDATSSYRRPNDFYDLTDAIGRWSLIALAALGIAAAVLTPSIRQVALTHKRFATSALAILGVSIIVSILPTILSLGGILLLLWAALRLIGTGLTRLKGAAGAGGAQG